MCYSAQAVALKLAGYISGVLDICPRVHSLNVIYDSQGSWNESEIYCVKWSWKN